MGCCECGEVFTFLDENRSSYIYICGYLTHEKKNIKGKSEKWKGKMDKGRIKEIKIQKKFNRPALDRVYGGIVLTSMSD